MLSGPLTWSQVWLMTLETGECVSEYDKKGGKFLLNSIVTLLCLLPHNVKNFECLFQNLFLSWYYKCSAKSNKFLATRSVWPGNGGYDVESKPLPSSSLYCGPSFFSISCLYWERKKEEKIPRQSGSGGEKPDTSRSPCLRPEITRQRICSTTLGICGSIASDSDDETINTSQTATHRCREKRAPLFILGKKEWISLKTWENISEGARAPRSLKV